VDIFNIIPHSHNLFFGRNLRSRKIVTKKTLPCCIISCYLQGRFDISLRVPRKYVSSLVSNQLNIKRLIISSTTVCCVENISRLISFAVWIWTQIFFELTVHFAVSSALTFYRIWKIKFTVYCHPSMYLTQCIVHISETNRQTLLSSHSNGINLLRLYKYQ
jgi:hypothetical protein